MIQLSFQTHEKGKQLATNVIRRQKPLEHPDIRHYQASLNESWNYKLCCGSDKGTIANGSSLLSSALP